MDINVNIGKDFGVGDVHVSTTDRPKKKKAKLFSTINSVEKGKFTITVPISKLQEDKRLVFGWASIIEKDGSPIVDHQGDVISEDDLEKTFYDFAKNGKSTGAMHEGSGFGDMVECMVFTKAKQKALGIDLGQVGAWVGFRVPPEVFAKIKSKEYRAFSIQGTGRRVPFDKNWDKFDAERARTGRSNSHGDAVAATKEKLWTFKQYSHGDNHNGFLDEVGGKVTVQDMDRHFKNLGYSVAHNRSSGEPITGQRADFAGFKNWAYTKDAGPYSESRASFDSKNGTHVRSVNLSTHTDHS